MARSHQHSIPLYPDVSFENALWRTGIQYLAGIDEAGRGALAGPVAAAAVVLPVTQDLVVKLKGVRDSKMMTSRAREHWAVQIKNLAVCYQVGLASNDEIDEWGIVPATILAIQRALEGLTVTPQHLLIDYIKSPDLSIPYTCLVKGDARCLSIAAASVLAKTARDALLYQLNERFPGYGLAQNKGYGTKAHRQSLTTLGRTSIHRKSFTFKEVGF